MEAAQRVCECVMLVSKLSMILWLTADFSPLLAAWQLSCEAVRTHAACPQVRGCEAEYTCVCGSLHASSMSGSGALTKGALGRQEVWHY